MADLTEMVLTGSFAAAFAVFVVSAAVRAGIRGKPRPVISSGRPEVDESSPYRTPAEDSASPGLPPELPVGKVPVWFFQPADLLGAGFVFLLFAWLFAASLGSPRDEAVNLDPGVLLVNIGFQFAIAGVVVILAMRRVGPAQWLGLRWRSWHSIFLIAPAAVAFMWAVFFGLEMSGYVKWMESLGVETVQETVQLLQKSNDPLVIGLMAAAAIIVAPLCEEIVFRGYFYSVMKKFAGAWPAAICSAMVFAAAHGSLAALLPLLIFGCLLVFIYEKTGSIWAPMAVHLCFNGATVVLQLVARHYGFPTP
jgi:membrane protease YdiL (CAAX protease family)